MRVLSLFVVFLFCLTPDLVCEVPVFHVDKLISSALTESQGLDFVCSWLLCGPIPNPKGESAKSEHMTQFEVDFLLPCGGEANPSIDEGQTVTYPGGKATWFRYDDPGNLISLDNALSNGEELLAYAYCEIESSCTQSCFLGWGSNDGGKLWLNGEVIWERPSGRKLRADSDLIPIVLQKGRNRILAKIEERAGVWGFACRFLPFDSQRYVNERNHMFRVVRHEDGSVVLQCKGAKPLYGDFIQSCRIEVASAQAADEVLWSTEWKGEEECAVHVPQSEYAEYVLTVNLKLAAGNEGTLKFPSMAGIRSEYLFFDGGRTDYTIVLAEDASESEVWAADELRHWLREASGADFPIAREPFAADHAPSGPLISIGWTQLARQRLGPETNSPDPLDESFTYRNIGPDILIWGGHKRGTMYGVMTFLEREMGIRWYTPEVSFVPKRARYAFTHLYDNERPSLRVRDDYYYHAFDPIWLARNKLNGSSRDLNLPGGAERYWGVHTFAKLMPPSEFFKDHPEYYSLIDGQRVAEDAQLCLTNPDVFKIFLERFKKVIRENPRYTIYSVSQNDCGGPCECEACQAIVDHEGSQAGPVLRFANRIAEAIETEFPDKMIGTLAYDYTRTPCKFERPRDNVVIRLCNIECCFAHPLCSCQENASFMNDLKAWSSIAPRLFIWDYVVNFEHYYLPFPNHSVLQANLKTFQRYNAIGVLEQGSYHTPEGEFAHLRAYMIAKLFWNVDCDIEQVVDDFMCGYYGKSGQYIRDYYNLLQGLVTPYTHFNFWLEPDDMLFSDGFIREALRILDDAERVADNEMIRRRVENVRIPVLYLKSYRSPDQASHDGTYARLKDDFQEIGMTALSERGKSHIDAFGAMMNAGDKK